MLVGAVGMLGAMAHAKFDAIREVLKTRSNIASKCQSSGTPFGVPP